LTAIGLLRHFEYFDNGIVEIEVEEVFHAPAHGGANFIGGYVRGLHEEQLILARGQHRADR